MHACYEHLHSKQQQPDGSYKKYYIKNTQLDSMRAENEIHSILEGALNNEIITKNEFIEMEPFGKEDFMQISKYTNHIRNEKLLPLEL